MEEQEAKIRKLEAKLAQAKLEIEKAYKEESSQGLDLSNTALAGGALALMIMMLK